MNLSKTTYYIFLGCAFILGIVAYVLRFTAYSGQEYGVTQEILSIVGNIFIVGVVVGFFTTVIQNFGLFKEELGNVIYAKDFLSNRKDINQIWLNVSRAVFEERFPKIQDDFLERMQEYLRSEDVQYYEDHETYINIEWKDEPTGMIKVTKKILFNLIATSNKEHPYIYKTWTNIESESDKVSCKLSIAVNGVIRNDAKVSDAKYNKNSVEHSIAISLKDSTKYSICITEEKEYNIHIDFLIGFCPKHLTNNLRIQIIHPESIKVLFSSSGTQFPFQEVNNTKTICENSYKNVILPRQGYIIALKPHKV